ncbi:SixA phosphatase family protein [Sphingomonas baiyangensis]|uniref:Histidine phosphatase family protein n=1 Tax=Sphingomonas baiyangensis TaxID=2572576 RepID=A0A4U1L0C4_9SPHN|nr:phosphoglycerate mutase family protein [Sphingomonas baiyangensis]TKD50014.1 histidine phosphatase family protein [Sphingomonas baiyangensis]
MRRRALLVLAGVALLAGCAGEAPSQTVYVMRHLHTPEGVTDAELTPEGHAAARTLAAQLEGQKLAAVFTTDFRRSRASVAPLLAARAMTAQLYDHRDPDALVARIRAVEGDVLVVGHSNTVPELVEKLGGARPAPMTHPDFGDLWVIRAGTSVRRRIG